jgi:putative acetyltransferase
MRVQVRKITRKDNPAVERIIKEVMPEFGASAPGFAIHDPDVLDMYTAYDAPRSIYLVCDVNGQVVGGGGIAPLKDGDDTVCELQKMYFLHSSRGKGYGNMLLLACLRAAKDFGYRQCYIETFHTMTQAISTYEKSGFKRIPEALGNTGHFACDMFFLLDLETWS